MVQELKFLKIPVINLLTTPLLYSLITPSKGNSFQSLKHLRKSLQNVYCPNIVQTFDLVKENLFNSYFIIELLDE